MRSYSYEHENVKVNVDSDITKAVDKVQDAVVSVINLQSQNQSSGFEFDDSKTVLDTVLSSDLREMALIREY